MFLFIYIITIFFFVLIRFITWVGEIAQQTVFFDVESNKTVDEKSNQTDKKMKFFWPFMPAVQFINKGCTM